MTYLVAVSQDEAGYWIAEANGVPGAHTFAESLDRLEPRVREAIALALDLEDADAIEIEFDLPPSLTR